MKKFIDFSLPANLKQIADIIWILAIAGIVVIVFVSIIALFGIGDFFSIEVPVSIDPEAVNYSVSSEKFNVERTTLEEAECEIYIERPSVLMVAGIGSIALLGAIVVLLVIYQLRKIFKTLIAEDPFIRENADRIRFMGWVIIIGYIVIESLSFGMSHFLIKQFSAEGLSFQADLDISLETILVGLVLLVLAKVFRVGTHLKEKQAE